MRLRSKASHLAKRVNSGVGAPGTVQDNVLMGQPAEHPNDFALDRGLVSLNLPAVEIGAVVRAGEFEIAHANCNLSLTLRVTVQSFPVSERHFTGSCLSHAALS